MATAVDRQCPPRPDYVVRDCGYRTSCWIWQRHVGRKGYGYTHVRTEHGWKTTTAYRAYWEALHGPVPDGMELDHLCRVRACCNPEHLEPVPHVVNIRRGAGTHLSPTQVQLVRDSKETAPQLADRLGVSVSVVQKARANRTHYDPKVPVRRRSHRAPLTDQEVAEIRAEATAEYSELAQRFGVSTDTIFRVRANLSHQDPNGAPLRRRNLVDLQAVVADSTTSLDELAARYGVSRARILQIRRESGLPNYRKLSPEQKQAIHGDTAHTVRELMALYGISEARVYQLRKKAPS